LSYGIVQPGNEFANGLPVIRPTDMKYKFVHPLGLKLIDPIKAESYKRTSLMGDELLLCVRGTTGLISLITDELKGANVTRGIVPVCFNKDKLSLQFGYYLFASNYVQNQIKDKTYGAALMQINIRDVRKLLMRIPSIKAQENIVKKLDSLSAETKKLEAIYTQKIADLDEMKKSVLQKAFSGQLSEL
ncbi:MAG: type I restriction enzyme S subunit, partial [Psychroserpens sp.]